MSDAVDELLVRLTETIALLRQFNETRWADWLERVRGWVAEGDYYGIEQLYRGFGGMGSFNDFILGGKLSHPQLPALIVWTQQDREANERLASLRDKIYTLCRQIRQDMV